LVYISCDPSTLARDVAYIQKSYRIESIQPVDMFPQSFHVETVCELSLRNADKH
jgi:23S rRNA (uracil1939-C5)-methyltransferase